MCTTWKIVNALCNTLLCNIDIRSCCKEAKTICFCAISITTRSILYSNLVFMLYPLRKKLGAVNKTQAGKHAFHAIQIIDIHIHTYNINNFEGCSSTTAHIRSNNRVQKMYENFFSSVIFFFYITISVWSLLSRDRLTF